MATTDLGKWMITNGGNYDPEATYEQLTMVMYENSTYITLRTVTGITPSNDNQNYILMAQGFDATALSSIQAEDTSGLLGESGGSVSAQSLVDYLADAVATKLLKKTDIATSIENSNSSVPASSLLYKLNSDLNDRNDVTDLLAEADVGINSKRIVNCSANTLNTPYKDGLTNASQGTAYINMANENFGTVIYVANSGYEIFLRKKGSGVWDTNWAKLTTNADLPNVFTGTNLVTLNSPSQLTAPGFYCAEYMSNDVNANSGSNPMSDYSTGDFHMLLLSTNANSTSGCRYGTLLVTSPRLASSLWIGRIWDYQFTYWAKK